MGFVVFVCLFAYDSITRKTQEKPSEVDFLLAANFNLDLQSLGDLRPSSGTSGDGGGAETPFKQSVGVLFIIFLGKKKVFLSLQAILKNIKIRDFLGECFPSPRLFPY